MQSPPPEPVADVYCRAFRAGLNWQHVLVRAKVHRSTWARILVRGSYNFSTIRKLDKAIDEMLAEDPANPDPVTEPAH